jgi:hypothetical protein
MELKPDYFSGKKGGIYYAYKGKGSINTEYIRVFEDS